MVNPFWTCASQKADILKASVPAGKMAWAAASVLLSKTAKIAAFSVAPVASVAPELALPPQPASPAQIPKIVKNCQDNFTRLSKFVFENRCIGPHAGALKIDHGLYKLIYWA